MEIKEFSFNLPQHLIAQYPSDRRGESRLLVMDRKKGTLVDSSVSEIAQYLPEDSVLVINNSKVRKARVYGKSETGGNVEFLFLSMISPSRWIAMVSKSKRQKVGKSYLFELPEDHVTGTIVEETADGKIVEFDRDLDEWFFDTIGHVPLPPYIKRDDEFSDENRYQTVYASSSGSVAAPTAGLHFTESVLETIRRKNITIAPVTLHVGPGTFLPVRSQNLEDHVMHREFYEVSEETSMAVDKAYRDKRPIIAVGTTSVRTLESAWDAENEHLTTGKGDTRLFITPGYSFSLVTHMMTNFHTPESTLLVLVSAFAGKKEIEKAYQHAIDREYHFFSYGDAMLIL